MSVQFSKALQCCLDSCHGCATQWSACNLGGVLSHICFKVLEMLIRIKSLQVSRWTVSPGVCTQLPGSGSQAPSSSFSPLAPSNFLRTCSSVLQQGTIYFYNYACLGSTHWGDRLKRAMEFASALLESQLHQSKVPLAQNFGSYRQPLQTEVITNWVVRT